MVNALFTRRGSDVRTPSTSVHISIASAPNPAAKIAAVKSDPPLPKVVVRPPFEEAMKPVVI